MSSLFKPTTRITTREKEKSPVEEASLGMGEMKAFSEQVIRLSDLTNLPLTIRALNRVLQHADHSLVTVETVRDAVHLRDTFEGRAIPPQKEDEAKAFWIDQTAMTNTVEANFLTTFGDIATRQLATGKLHSAQSASHSATER